MYDIIGDVHSCAYELEKLLVKLGQPNPDKKVIFVGDLFDRGPFPQATLEIFKSVGGHSVMGNHDDKLLRWAKGNKVLQNHGLDKTAKAFENIKEELLSILQLPHYKCIEDFVVVHAAWKETLLKYGEAPHKKTRSWCLYGPNTGRTLSNGLPDRIDWVATRRANEDSKTIIYGHQPHDKVRIENKTYGIDTGCVFGGKLTAIKVPEMEIIEVKAKREYSLPLWGKYET